MATGRVASILKSRSGFSDEEIARMTEQQAWQWIYNNTPLPRRTESTPTKTDNSLRL